jgi:hypothetical protein
MTVEKQALEDRDAALRAAMKQFDAKVEAVAAREAAMVEKEDGERGGEVPEELKNVAAEVKPFDSTATIRKQIDEQQAVLTSLFRVFGDVDVEDCKFKITHVARNLLALEGKTSQSVIHGFVRRRILEQAIVLTRAGVEEAAGFHELITAITGCAAIPTFNTYLAKLQQIGISPDAITQAAFGQHARTISSSDVTYNAIRGIRHAPRSSKRLICCVILLDGIKQCPEKVKRGEIHCRRHIKRQKL